MSLPASESAYFDGREEFSGEYAVRRGQDQARLRDALQRSVTPAITLPADWSDCERGNTWLTAEGDHYALIELAPNRHLEISMRLANYPGLNVTVVDADEATLAAHIRQHFAGWDVRKCHVPGVEISDDQIVGEEAAELNSPETADPPSPAPTTDASPAAAPEKPASR